MITLVLVILIAFVLVSSASLLHALNHAVDGFEDESGFHQGRAPQPADGLAVAMSVRLSDRAELAWIESAHAEHLPNQMPGKPLGAY
jgi:hypothetical protein